MATIKEAFTLKYQGNINVEIEDISSVSGEEVQLL
jgi:hypothetical protein